MLLQCRDNLVASNSAMAQDYCNCYKYSKVQRSTVHYCNSAKDARTVIGNSWSLSAPSHQKSRHFVTSRLQCYSQWGLTLVILSIYIRTMIK